MHQHMAWIRPLGSLPPPPRFTASDAAPELLDALIITFLLVALEMNVRNVHGTACGRSATL